MPVGRPGKIADELEPVWAGMTEVTHFTLKEGEDAGPLMTGARRAIAGAPGDSMHWYNLSLFQWASGLHRDAARAMARAGAAGYAAEAPRPKRSVVIPVLDYSPNSPYDIVGLLADLEGFEGEVICIFNSAEVFADLREHPRIDKFSYNKHNVGVARSWNIGLNQAEGDVVFVLNADLKVSLAALDELERYLFTLPNALAVGMAGEMYDMRRLKIRTTHYTGTFTAPLAVDKVSGYAFALHSKRLHDAGISFDPRLSPFFCEEFDLLLKAHAAGFEVYAAPVLGIEHVPGISAADRPIYCFGRKADRMRVLIRNANLILDRAER